MLAVPTSRSAYNHHVLIIKFVFQINSPFCCNKFSRYNHDDTVMVYTPSHLTLEAVIGLN